MKVLHIFLTLTVLVCATVTSSAQNKIATNTEKIALGGYDVVAYFKSHDAVRGNSENSVDHHGVTYYFISPENATTFKSNPSAYQPRYGGYCAFAMATQGKMVPADPQTFKIRDGKLYLFYNDYYQGKPFNTIVPWNNNEKELIVKADDNWEGQN
ncbi:YHS domain protein [Muricauda sp. JGD-17]|uniref:YHS domain protein n=1 Tax=Flagellimonas ochracea TaxID=2696472 RepID=A0A964TCI6_9FLAO|nr:YHS domain-containing (seleno)protein [Allomuricauda ochracea]NAY91671.1 YHS domain protein [Allomuricauda ochracea]